MGTAASTQAIICTDDSILVDQVSQLCANNRERAHRILYTALSLVQMTCPNGHGPLEPPHPSGYQYTGSYGCDLCGESGLTGTPETRWCQICNFDVCPSCVSRTLKRSKSTNHIPYSPNSLMSDRMDHTDKEFSNIPEGWFECAANGKADELGHFIGFNSQWLNLQDTEDFDWHRYGFTALTYAACNGENECVEVLINAEASVDIQGNGGFTALHWAALYGNDECVHKLIKAGATLDIKSTSGRTPLHGAVANGNEACTESLLKAGAAVDVTNNDGFTALHRAAYYGYYSICKLLLEHGANAHLTDFQGETALVKATKNANAEVASLLAGDGDDAVMMAKGCFRPVYVCLKEAFLRLERLIEYEEAVALSYVVPFLGNGSILFCSHRWLNPKGTSAHPDNTNNTKLKAVQAAILLHPNFVDVTLIWMDFLCVPQHNSEEQLLAINSLPYIVQQSTHFLVIEGISGICNDTGEDEASLAVYQSRGWCLVECLSAQAAREIESQVFNAWRCNINTGVIVHFELDTMEKFNPFEGNFAYPKDKERIALMVLKLCSKFTTCPAITKIKTDSFEYLPGGLKKRYQNDLSST